MLAATTGECWLNVSVWIGEKFGCIMLSLKTFHNNNDHERVRDNRDRSIFEGSTVREHLFKLERVHNEVHFSGTSTTLRRRAVQQNTSSSCGRRDIRTSAQWLTSWTRCASWGAWMLWQFWKRTTTSGYSLNPRTKNQDATVLHNRKLLRSQRPVDQVRGKCESVAHNESIALHYTAVAAVFRTFSNVSFLLKSCI